MFLRHCILILFSIFFIRYHYAQNWEWAYSIGGTSKDEAYSSSSDQDGNLYITGYFGTDGITFGNTSLTSKGGFDVFLAKYDPDGNALWARSAGGTGNDFGFSLTTDPTGNICLTGIFAGDSLHIGTIALENKGGSDVFLAKYDELGNLLWAKSAGGAEADESYGVSTDDQANIFITGQFTSSSLSFDQTSVFNSNAGFQEIFIAKFDAGGNIQWAKTAAGSHNDIAYSIVATKSGDAYITGYFRSLTIGFSQELLLNTAPAREMFIAKYNGNGDVVWAKKAGGEQNDVAYSVNLRSQDVLMVTGAYRSDSIIFGNTVLKNNQSGYLDFFFTQYDTSGQVLSATGGGGTLDDQAFFVVPDQQSSLFLAGGYFSPSMVLGDYTLFNNGDSTLEMFMVKYDQDGNITWSESFGGEAHDYFNWLSPGTPGQVYATGFFDSPSIILGNHTLQNNGGGDVFIARLSSVIDAYETMEVDNDNLYVYPNPVHENFTVEVKNIDHSATIELYNSLGEKLFTRNFSGRELIKPGIDFRFVPGLYILLVRDGENQMVKKLVIE